MLRFDGLIHQRAETNSSGHGPSRGGQGAIDVQNATKQIACSCGARRNRSRMPALSIAAPLASPLA